MHAPSQGIAADGSANIGVPCELETILVWATILLGLASGALMLLVNWTSPIRRRGHVVKHGGNEDMTSWHTVGKSQGDGGGKKSRGDDDEHLTV